MIVYNQIHLLRKWEQRVAVRLLSVICAFGIIPNTIWSTPQNNVFDMAPIYNTMGTDKFYSECPFRFSLSVAPIYQHTESARNGAGKKVAAGERLGNWRFLPVLFNIEKAAEKTFDATNYKQLHSAKQAIIKMEDPASSTTPKNTLNHTYHFVNDDNGKYYDDENNQHAEMITDEELRYDPRDKYRTLFSYIKVPATYERFGLRGQGLLVFGCGFGMRVRGGVADVRFKPHFDQALSESFLELAGVTATFPPEKDTSNIISQTSFEYLLSDKARMNIGKELGIDMEEFCGTYPEDTHVALFWHMPFNFCDHESEPACMFVPYFSCGAWIPTGREHKAAKMFSVPTGNNGFFGVTLESALSFVFPGVIEHQSAEYSVGCGALFNPGSRDIVYRVPSSKCQSGLYPWKILLTNEPGSTWYGNVSCKFENFVPGLSCYIDYIYTRHMRDTFKLDTKNLGSRPANEITEREKVFTNAMSMERLADESKWTAQLAHIGFNYHIAQCLSVGCAVQWHIKGTRVYKPETVLGSVTFEF